MKTKIFSLFLIIFFCARAKAQEFIGYVKKADSTASPIFQAKVEITEGDKPFKLLKTYFDGSFKFLLDKNQTYSIKITYSGYTDTAYTITSDKNGKPDMQSVTVGLNKDGMRLMGMIKNREEDFPIKGATIVLKNVMTRKEDRITTDIDGRYNFKLEYETSYKVWIDKRSPGIFNLYTDTSFYISTIGFNLPLDYKLDISLDKMLVPLTPVRQGYKPAKQTINKNAEPVITKDTTEEKKPMDSAAVIAIEKETKPQQEKAKPEVVAIRGTVRESSINTSVSEEKAQPLTALDVIRQKALEQKKAREADTVHLKTFYLTKPQQDLIDAAERFATRKKFDEDSIAKVKEQELKKIENTNRLK